VTVDLSPLEEAAARVGLAGLKARVVEHDRRRGWWFWWGDRELLVSDRVIDHCSPADASALLIDEVLRRREARRRARPWEWIAVLVVAAIIVAFVHDLVFWRISFPTDAQLASGTGDEPSMWLEGLPWFGLVLVLAVSLATWFVLSTRASERADDATVALLGDATPLVRGLNEMNFEEIHILGKRLPARPDLHRRAERLVRLHRLCESQPPT
jgi:2-polyprenyl-6-methoxyphenol hydroxylase-like FAD-dependent oxidoreductase